MDWIDEIEGSNNRNIETAEMVSAYMRANAQRAAQKQAQAKVDPVPKDDVPKEPEQQDKLDFSSEFSTGDMGLNSQGGFQQIQEWKRQIEEDEEGERKEDDEDGSEGGWREKEPEHSGPDQEPESEALETSEEDAWKPPARPAYTPPPRTSFIPPPAPPPAPPEPSGPRTPQAAPPPPQAATCGNAPAALVDDPNAPAGQVSLPASFSQAQSAPRPVARPVSQAPIALPERVRPLAHVALPSSGQLAQVDPDVAEVARRLIASPAHEEGYEECVRLLARFGVGALRMCSRQKVSVEILDEQGFGSHPGLLALGLSAEETPSDGAYLVERRLVLVDRRSLTGKPRFFHPALYYFAHAFDHAQGGETFSSRKAAAVVACFEASTRAYMGFDFVDELAAADPIRYFARSVAVYLGRDDCEDPLWSHQDLYDFDRSMYDYLQYLFARLAA